MEKRFVIKWEIDIFANTPEEAIAKAILSMPHPARDEESLATVFNVEEHTANGVIKHGNLDVEEFDDNQRERFVNVLDGNDDEQ